MISIAIDAMGGDIGPPATVSGTLSAMEANEHLRVVFVGDSEAIRQQLKHHGRVDSGRIAIEHAEQVVEMTDAPAQALRSKRKSSMRIAVNLLQSGEVQACVSAGNTGALMAISKYVLDTFPGIQRPAIIGQLPTIRGHVHMLDLGANVDSSAAVLLQFGIMGSTFVKYMNDTQHPSVALLNNGSEDIKGSETVKQAAALFRESSLKYHGFIEGDEIYTGDVDIIVCDGFLGNIALKTSEGVSKLIQHAMNIEFRRNVFRKIAGVIAMPSIRGLRNAIDPRLYNGAAFLGLKGNVIKSHGNADSLAFDAAVRKAVEEVKFDIPAQIGREISHAPAPAE